jgi:hypothetical protein
MKRLLTLFVLLLASTGITQTYQYGVLDLTYQKFTSINQWHLLVEWRYTNSSGNPYWREPFFMNSERDRDETAENLNDAIDLLGCPELEVPASDEYVNERTVKVTYLACLGNLGWKLVSENVIYTNTSQGAPERVTSFTFVRER